MELEELKRAIEAILFAAGERIDISRLSAVLETDEKEIESAADALMDTYSFERRGIRIIKLEKGYHFCPGFLPDVRRKLRNRSAFCCGH